MGHRILLLLIFKIICFSCQKEITFESFPDVKTDISKNHIIPRPFKVITDSAAFIYDARTYFVNASNNPRIDALIELMKKQIQINTNLDSLNMDEKANFKGRPIIFELDSLEDRNHEAYQLHILKDSIVISSNSPQGAFYASQTLRQLIPYETKDSLTNHPVYVIPTGKIIDRPKYSHRGTMLDVARHFFKPEDVKKYIDVLAYYKINVLHLHLSDDQGWRIEIKSWPKLTEIGSKSEVGGGPGGFYTQEEYSEIVDYAAQHFITIIPEIDMPGHTNAASFSYPILNGNGKELEAYTGMRVGFSTFDTKKDTVYKFIEDVVKEISNLTPGPYFHIGGDESHSTKKEDYIQFVNKVEKIVQKNGKKMIGWDEIATANVDQSSISQFWQNDKNALLAKTKGMKIIFSPAQKVYLDMKYNDSTKLGLTWAGRVPIDTSYNWNPADYVKGISKDDILGIEGPLWSETISDLDELQYLAFPRIIGIAEIGWSEDENRNWQDYRKRLGNQYTFLTRNRVNFYEAPQVDWVKIDSIQPKLRL